mmetsp:Transcript_2429/g.7027  ORF Transcript_2429/g.7027 Transcript_2429/m.7027 type:complete len:205 (+) Transcript_2429:663-1277(+)
MVYMLVMRMRLVLPRRSSECPVVATRTAGMIARNGIRLQRQAPLLLRRPSNRAVPSHSSTTACLSCIHRLSRSLKRTGGRNGGWCTPGAGGGIPGTACPGLTSSCRIRSVSQAATLQWVDIHFRQSVIGDQLAPSGWPASQRGSSPHLETLCRGVQHQRIAPSPVGSTRLARECRSHGHRAHRETCRSTGTFSTIPDTCSSLKC